MRRRVAFWLAWALAGILVAMYAAGIVYAFLTLAIAALFGPLRRRIQNVIDRRFYRRKYDASRILAAYGTRPRDEVDLKTLSDDLMGVVRETVQPAHASLWLRSADGTLPAEERKA